MDNPINKCGCVGGDPGYDDLISVGAWLRKPYIFGGREESVLLCECE